MIMELAGKQVAIVGLGESGVAAAELCLERGARVLAFDEASPERLGAGAHAVADLGARLTTGPQQQHCNSFNIYSPHSPIRVHI
jgi:UDP-N-acetylmuramoylalanine--D-glutamate ligase